METPPALVRLLEHRWALAVVTALAVVLRVAHVYALRSTPWFDHLVIDPEFYDAWAQQLAAGDWLGTRAFYMDPLYPYLLGALYRVWGHDLLAVRLLQVVLSGGSCVLVGWLGRRIGGRAVGTLAALGFALYEPEIFYVGEIDKTCLSVFLTAAALVLALGSSRAARLGAGVATGLGTLTRANLLLLAPLAVVARSRRPATAALYLAGLLAVLLPVAWRNHHVSGEWVLTTTQAGQNFYTGNNPTNPYGAYGALPFVRGNPHFEETDFRAEAERRTGRTMSAREVSRFWFAEALRHMRAQPAFAARAMVRKLALFWNHFEISDNQDQYLLEEDSWVLRLPLLGFGHVAALALLGAAVTIRGRRDVRFLCAFIVVYGLSVVAFFMFSRYRIQTVPALLPLAAVGVTTLGNRTARYDWRGLATAGAVVLVGALASFATIGIFWRNQPQVTEMRLCHLAQIYRTAGNPDRAIAAYQEAVAQCPGCTQALAELVDAYVATGRRVEGNDWLASFVARHPGHPDAARHLARLQASAPP